VKAQRYIAVAFLYPWLQMGVGGQRHAPTALPPGRDPVTIIQEAGLSSGLLWTDIENLYPAGVRAPDSRTHSELLDRLSCHNLLIWMGCRHVQIYSVYAVLEAVFESRTYEIGMWSAHYHCGGQFLGYDICLLTAVGLTPGGSSTVHVYTETIHRTTQ
jgi:hypothetical protein